MISITRKPNKKVRICLILLNPVVGGNETFMFNLVTNLSREKFEILFVLFNREGENAHLIPQDIKVIDLGMPIPPQYELFNIYFILKLAILFRQFKPNIIFSTSGYPNILTILAKSFAFIKSTLIIREITARTKLFESDKLYKIKIWVYKYLYQKADIIVAPSPYIFKNLQSFIPLSEKRFHLVPNFISEESLKKNLLVDLVLNQYNLKLDRPVIMSIARLTQEKGIDLGITAFAKLTKEIPCYYWIVGNGPQEKQLKELTKTLCIEDSVCFLGYQKNPHVFLQHANIFLLPSRFEGFSNALLEAMYMGIPCIVTRYDEYISEFINDRFGILAEKDDVVSLTKAMKTLINSPDLQRKLGQMAQKKIKENHMSPIIINQFERIFLDLEKTT